MVQSAARQLSCPPRPSEYMNGESTTATNTTQADVAQTAEQAIRNRQVVGSIPTTASNPSHRNFHAANRRFDIMVRGGMQIEYPRP